MELGFMPGRKFGIHYDLARFAVKHLRSANLLVKGKSERQYEFSIVSHLEASRKLKNKLITQVGEEEIEKITQSSLFGFRHRPDTAIGRDGTAIEIKVVASGTSMRGLLGQAIAYRMAYRFVILVIVDHTTDRGLVALCEDKKSQEHALLQGLADEFNVFTVVGPAGRGKNLVFLDTLKKNLKKPDGRDQSQDGTDDVEGDG